METKEEIQKYINNRLNVVENIIEGLNSYINELSGTMETIRFLNWLKENKNSKQP